MKKIVLIILSTITFTASKGQKSFGFGFKIENNNVIVNAVFTKGPSYKAGLKKADIVLKINTVEFSIIDTSLFLKTFAEANDNSQFLIKRNGTTIKLNITKEDKKSFLNICLSGNCKNGKGVFIDKYGNEYDGNFSNEIMNGTGKMQYTNGGKYDGIWSMGKPNGFGKAIMNNGDSYQGNYIDGFFDGEGTYTKASGETYTSFFKKGKFDGTVKKLYNGELTTALYKDGVVITSFKDAKETPPADPNSVYVKDLKLEDGSTFSGYKLNNKFNGFGIYIFTNGQKYEGNFKDDIRTGKGIFTFKSGDVYTGNWDNDKINGFGKLEYKNGEAYEGNWKDGIKTGKGKLISKTAIIEQNWVNSKQNGESKAQIFKNGELQYTLFQNYVDDKVIDNNQKVIYSNGDVYEGGWSYSKAKGIAKYTYKNGDIENGKFESGQRQGLFEFKPKNGKAIKRYYTNDIFIGTYTNDKLIYINGDIFEGKLVNGLQNGQGKLTTKQGIISGTWVDGFLEGDAVTVSKIDGTTSANKYKKGEVISETLNSKKFTEQILKLTKTFNGFQDIIGDDTDLDADFEDKKDSYKIAEKLSGFAICEVLYYSSNISSSGKPTYVYRAETEQMTKADALTMCTKLEAIFEKIKFSTPAKKDVEYNVETRRLVNYTFNNKLPVINLDAGGDDKWWSVTIRINK